jgi:hypothetical protein
MLSTAAPLSAQACDWGWVGENPASLGIGRLLCIGGACEINVDTRDGLAHRFATEPRVTELRAPASRVLEDRDIIVAIEGQPITTPEGGRRLAQLTVGTPVVLTIRRQHALQDVRLVPIPGCPIGALSVRIRDEIPAR